MESQVSELGSGASLGSLGAALLLAFVALSRPPTNWLLEYYPSSTFEGPATRAWIPRERFRIPGAGLLSGLPEREDFSIRLRSCVVLTAPGNLIFSLRADDHARLFVNDQLILETDGNESDSPQKRLKLDAGIHLIAIEYVNVEGAAELQLDLKQNGVFDFRSLHGLIRRPSASGQCNAG